MHDLMKVSSSLVAPRGLSHSNACEWTGSPMPARAAECNPSSRVRLGLRAEAAKKGLDPNIWRNNVELIAARRIGEETVTYVANIYRCYVAYRQAQMEEVARKEERERLRGDQVPATPR
jgi:hypothetical protein